MIIYVIELFKPDEHGDSYFEETEGYSTYDLAFRRYSQLKKEGDYPIRLVKTEVLCEYFSEDQEFIK